MVTVCLFGQDKWNSSSLWLEKNEIIEIQPPPGAKRLRISFKNDKTNEWESGQISHLPGDSEGKVFFRIPFAIERNNVRFEWNAYDPLPYSFYSGISNFSTRAANPNGSDFMLARTFASETSVESSDSDQASNEVEESDIWKIDGNHLFFFNQRRGLQIVDIEEPRKPQVLARYRLPASGEQMYISDSGKFIFLFVTPPHQSWPYKSELRILKFTDEQISEISKIQLSGHYRESRMVGETLHILCEEWQSESTDWLGWSYNYHTHLISLEMGDPEKPEEIYSETTLGSPQVIFATSDHLVVVVRDPKNYYQGHLVRVYDLTDPSKIPREISLIQPGGRILDKFKIRIHENTLTLISQAYRENQWSQRYSLLENFDLNSGELLGSIELADEETLYATRFDGDFAYIVTFLQTDPLFIIDLSNPTNPVILSELIVPGWSEYLQVEKDYLFAVGVEENRVTGSVFNISDKTNPSLAQRIYMGDEDEYSWSEANYDEKAIGQVSSKGLFFIPFQTWNEGDQQNRLQILQLENGVMQKGGQISHQVEARRSVTDHTGLYLFSISGEELVVSDILDLNFPNEVERFPLAWTTDRVHLLEDLAIQIENSPSNYWGWGIQNSERNASVRLTELEDFDNQLGKISLGSGQILGSLLSNNLLHLLSQKENNLFAHLLEVSEEGIQKLASSQVKLNSSSQALGYEGFLLEDNFICWAPQKNNSQWVYPYARISVDYASDIYGPYPYDSTLDLQAFVFSYRTGLASSSIDYESNATFRTNTMTEVNGPHFLGTKLLYGSTSTIHHHQDQDYYNIVASETNSSLISIDLSNPEKLVIKQNIPSPGILEGTQTISEETDTAYLFFANKDAQVGNYRPFPLYEPDQVEPMAFVRALSICAYDGSNIYLMDEINLPDNFVPIAISDEFAFIAEAGENMMGVKAFQVNQSGKLAHVSTLFESITINELVAKGSTLIGKSQQGIHSSFGLSEWPMHEQSGNFYFSLDQFDISDNGVAIPTGAYGVEWIDKPADKTNDSQATRRSSLSNSWQNMDEDQIWIYSFEDSPVHFDLNATRTWKFRPNTSIDEQSNALVKNWKSTGWFGSFYDFHFPWIFQQNLKWVYFKEANDGSFWLWSSTLGWIWSTPSIFPYCFSSSNNAWIFIDQKNTIELKYFDFKSRKWSQTSL
ncbi:MAG: beta-propeller domain-containing protein [Verrucomicrobiota bacterium]|nr:beta-propeller domain-containing protein [Verrucomicrobiota bacterium]